MWAEFVAFLRCRWRRSKRPCREDYCIPLPSFTPPPSLLTSATGVVVPAGVTHTSLFVLDDDELQKTLDDVEL